MEEDILKQLGMASALRAKTYGSVAGHHIGRITGLVTNGFRHPKTGMSMLGSFFNDILVHTAIGMARAGCEYELAAQKVEANKAAQKAATSQG